MTLKTQPFAENKKLARMMGALPFDPQPQGDATGEQGQPAGELTPEATEKIRRNAQMTDELIGIYRAAGKLEEAAGLEQQYFNQVLTIAQLNTKMAENIWNHSFLSDKYGSLTLKPRRKLKTTLHDGKIVVTDEQTGELVEVTDLGRYTQHGESLYFTKDGIANEIIMGKPKPPQRSSYEENGFNVTDEWREDEGRHVRIAKSPKWKPDGEAGTGAGKSHKSAQDGLKADFIHRYGKNILSGSGATSDPGEKIDFDRMIALLGSETVPDQIDPQTGRPLTVLDLYNNASTYLEKQLASGKSPQAALAATRNHVQGLGLTDLGKAKKYLSPEELGKVRAGKGRAVFDSEKGVYHFEPTSSPNPVTQWIRHVASPDTDRRSRRPAREKKPEALPEQETPPVSLREDAKRRIRSLPGAVDMEDTGKVEKQILESRMRDADPEREKAEIERLASYYRRQGAPPDYARKRAEERVKPKYEELRRIIAEYLGEGEQ